MAGHHVDLPEQVVTPGEELWVKIIDIDLQRRRISLSIKQAAEGGEVSEEYREAFGEHAYDEQGNYIGFDYAGTEFTPETEAQAAWAEYVAEHGSPPEGGGAVPPAPNARRPPVATPDSACRRQPSPEAAGAGAETSSDRAAEAPRRSHRGRSTATDTERRPGQTSRADPAIV